MEFYIPRIGNDRVKDRIMENLILKPRLALKEICLRVSRTNSVTYQAVHKAIGELTERGILSKEEKYYKISHAWTEKLKDFAVHIEQNCCEIFDKINNMGIVKLDFNSQLNFGKFIFSFVSKLQESQIKSIFVNSWHIYNMLWLSETELKIFDNLKDLNIHILSDSESAVDKWLARAWEDIGVKVSYGAQNCKSCDYIVIDDIIIEVYWNKQIREDWEKQRSAIKINQYNMMKGLHHIASDDKPMKVIIFKDPDLASEIKQRTLSKFARI